MLTNRKNAVTFNMSRTKAKPSKKPCGACARRRAKLRKILKRFMKGSPK